MLLVYQAQLAAALASRQQELVQHCCAACGSLLLSPHRASPCRHPICALCYEAGGGYWCECLCCAATVTGWDADRTIAEVMAARMGPKPAAVVARVSGSWSKRLQAAQAESAGSVRLLFEWGFVGSSLHPSGERRTLFLRSATTGGVRAGQEVRGL